MQAVGQTRSYLVSVGNGNSSAVVEQRGRRSLAGVIRLNQIAFQSAEDSPDVHCLAAVLGDVVVHARRINVVRRCFWRVENQPIKRQRLTPKVVEGLNRGVAAWKLSHVGDHSRIYTKPRAVDLLEVAWSEAKRTRRSGKCFPAKTHHGSSRALRWISALIFQQSRFERVSGNLARYHRKRARLPPRIIV